jgi:hypothetical protein
MSQTRLYLPPYTEAWINADTGETSVREPYKVIYWVLRKSGQAKEGDRNVNKKELENKVGTAFATLTKEAPTPELITLQHDLRKTQPEDKDYLELVLLELRRRARKEE